jgi:phage terminase Nu1 subunit (DNA packaging protein)
MFERLKSQSVNFAALGLVCGIVVLVYSNQLVTQWLQLAMTISFFASVFNYWRLLKITEAPLSTIAAAAQGYVELYGKAKTDKLLKTPYQSIPCVWYRAWVYANREVEGEDDTIEIGGKLLNYTESQLNFSLDDGTGQCTVNPKGAEVVYFEARTWRKNDHRYVEEYLPVNKPIYVIGQLDTRHDVLDDEAVKKYLIEKLNDWKSNKQQLLNRFDQNRDGQIDMVEWEQARQEAHKQVLAEHAMRANLTNQNGSEFTLAKPAGKLFLISAKSPQQLHDSYKTWLAIQLGVLAILLVFFIKLA